MSAGPSLMHYEDDLVRSHNRLLRTGLFALFAANLVLAGALPVLAQDLSLLHALGIKIVIVHGSRPQVAEQLALRNVEGRFHNGIRITDTAALECSKEAAGELRLDIEAAFSQGLPNTPMAHSAAASPC